MNEAEPTSERMNTIDVSELNMDIDEVISLITNEEDRLQDSVKSDRLHDSNSLLLQKLLAKLILDTKYESIMAQTSVDSLLSRFKSYFNEAIDLYETDVN